MTTPRVLPRLDTDNRPFWTGGEQGKLQIMHCADCDGFIHPPRPICRHCLSENVAPATVSGKGTIDTFTINHQPWFPGMEVPFVIARVALDDAPGVFLTTNIIGSPVAEVDIGDPVQVTFLHQDDVWIPLFEKVN
ncbi:Zn-ribbon domain-containing OB-fold protein [Zhongshania sp.]|uniref:Zn-ribbon domain-containing OB-fold protein n=1 Tax=Zhongshania sp. TaxID=1971902 RepID=UPI003565B13E